MILGLGVLTHSGAGKAQCEPLKEHLVQEAFDLQQQLDAQMLRVAQLRNQSISTLLRTRLPAQQSKQQTAADLTAADDSEERKDLMRQESGYSIIIQT